MGLDYSFEFVGPRSRASELLAGLAGQVEGAYAEALRGALPWRPQTPGRGDAGIRGLRPVFEIPNYYDIVVMIGVDAEVRRFFADSGQRARDRMIGGKAAVGLVYMKMYAGAEHVRLTLTAATSGMSRMFAGSAEARRTMVAAARAGQARALFLDDEQDARWELVEPLPRGSDERHVVPRPPEMRLQRPEEVDEYCRQALALAGLGAGLS